MFHEWVMLLVMSAAVRDMEVRIGHGSHFWHVETSHLIFLRGAERHDHIRDLEPDEGKDAYEDEASSHVGKLRHEL